MRALRGWAQSRPCAVGVGRKEGRRGAQRGPGLGGLVSVPSGPEILLTCQSRRRKVERAGEAGNHSREQVDKSLESCVVVADQGRDSWVSRHERSSSIRLGVSSLEERGFPLGVTAGTGL